MPSCVVRGCMCTWKKRDPSRILHTFPKEPERIRHWLQQTGQYDDDIEYMVVKVYLGKVYDSYRMCSLHFTDDSYIYDGYRRTLRKNAVPTIFNTKKTSTVPSTSVVSTNIPSVSGSSSSSSEQHIPSTPAADGQKPSCSSTICTYQFQLPVVPPKASTEDTIQEMTSSSVQQGTSAVSGFTEASYGGQLEQRTPANLQQSTSATVILLQKPSSSMLTNSDLPLDSQLGLEPKSSSTKTLSSTTSSCPIISSSPASSSVISTSEIDKLPYKTSTDSSIGIPLSVVSDKKTCSMAALPVSGNISSVTQTSPTTSSLAQKLPSISCPYIVRIPLKTPTSQTQTAIPDSLPPSKKRKLEENDVLLESSATSTSNESVVPIHCMSETSVNTSKVYFVSSSAPVAQPSCLIQRPLMVDKGVNTDFFTNRKSCCISTDHFYRRRNAQTQTKIDRKNRKIMCTLLPGKRTNLSVSTVSRRNREIFSDCSPSESNDDDDPYDVREAVNVDLLKVEILSDSELDASVPTSHKKQAIHIKEVDESFAGQAVLSPKSFQSTCTIQNFDSNTLKLEPNIKRENDQFPISSSQNLTRFVSQNLKIKRISPIKSELLSPVCRKQTSCETSAVQTDDEPEDLNDSSFHINELSEDEDESFLAPSDAEDEDNLKHVFQDLDSPVENLVEEEKYIVFESCLKKLIMMIPCRSKIKCMSPLIQYRKETIGSHLSIEVRCRSGHTSLLWESQPRYGYQPLGNVLLSAAVLFSGSSFLKAQHMFNLMKLKSIDKATYHKNQFMYLFPAINHHWKEEQKSVIQDVQERPLCLAGDQQLDSSGFSANYSIYSMMDVTSKKICSFSVEPVSPQLTLEDLEKIGFQRAMGELQTMNADVEMIVTDRSVAIQEIVKENYPSIVHQLDLWHLSKSIGDDVLMAAKQKDCEILYQWVEAIRNHILWSSRTCSKDPDLLIHKWKSIIQHVTNVHEWDDDDSDCKACNHPPLTEDVISSTNWLEKDSAAHDQLRKIVENTSLLKDLKQLSFRCHTGELEIYHKTCLKYRPKRSHFFMDSMVARTQLAALDHNRSVHRVKAIVENGSSGDALGTMTEGLDVFKGQKSWIIKALYKPFCQHFLFDIINDAIAFVKKENTF